MVISSVLIYSGIALTGGTASWVFEKCNRPDLAITADNVTKVFLIGGVVIAGWYLWGATIVFI